MNLYDRLRENLSESQMISLIDRLEAKSKKQKTKSYNPSGASTILAKLKSKFKSTSYRPSGNSYAPAGAIKGGYDPVRMAKLREKLKKKGSFFSGFFTNA